MDYNPTIKMILQALLTSASELEVSRITPIKEQRKANYLRSLAYVIQEFEINLTKNPDNVNLDDNPYYYQDILVSRILSELSIQDK